MSNSESVLRKALQEIAIEHEFKDYDVDIKNLSTDGANYTAALFKITLTPFQQAQIKLFAKVAVASESTREQTGGRLYENEQFFYTQFYPELERIQSKFNISSEYRLKVPKFYGCSTTNGEETIVLEDLAESGFRCLDRMKCFNWEYASRSVEQLARLHALSFSLQRENPPFFDQIKEKFKNIEQSGVVQDVFGKLIQNAPLLVNSELREKLQAYIEKNQLTDAWLESLKPTDQQVFVHADFRISNLMHRRKNGKLEIIPVDFQTMFFGSPIVDLMYFIYTGSDEEFRKLYYKKLLEHYYNELKETLRRLGLDINEIYPRNVYDDDLSRLKMLGLTLSLTVLIIVCVDTESAPELGAEFSAFAMKPSKTYVERLNGVVKDYVKWGYL